MRRLLAVLLTTTMLLGGGAVCPITGSAYGNTVRVLSDFSTNVVSELGSNAYGAAYMAAEHTTSGGHGNSAALKLFTDNTSGGYVHYTVYAYDATACTTAWRDNWNEARYLQFWVKNGSGTLTVTMGNSTKKDSGANNDETLHFSQHAEFWHSENAWQSSAKFGSENVLVNGNGHYELRVPTNYEGWVRIPLNYIENSAYPALTSRAESGKYVGQIGQLEFTFGTVNTTAYIDDIALVAGSFSDTPDANYQFAPTDNYYHLHDWQAATCTTPKTCTDCGATEGSANGHTWVKATCTTPKTCSVCKVTEGEPTYEHIYNEDGVCTSGCGSDAAKDLSTYFGYCSNSDLNALRFGFKIQADGVVRGDNYVADITKATVTLNGVTHKLSAMGGIISNNPLTPLTFAGAAADSKRTLVIPAEKVIQVDGDQVYYAIGVRNIPTKARTATIYCRTYVTYIDQNTGHSVTVYSDVVKHSVQDYIDATATQS